MPKGFSSIILIVLGLLIIVIVAGGAYLVGRTSVNTTTLPSVAPLETAQQATPNLSITAAPEVKNYPGTKEFISQKLKIAFNYLPEVNGVKFQVKEVENKVYIGMSTTKIEDGQFVEVFQKDPQDSLKDAIKKRFLAGKSETDCFVIDSPMKFNNYPSTYQALEISFPKPTNNDEPWFASTGKCFADYAQTNGIRYFLGDSQHPDKLLFFSIGQYGIDAGPSLTWQDTIRFLD